MRDTVYIIHRRIYLLVWVLILGSQIIADTKINAAGGSQSETREIINLTDWEFQFSDDIKAKSNTWRKVRLPYTWNNRDENSGWFKKQISIPSGWAGKRIYLKLRGIECDAVVFIDKQKIIELAGPDAQADITSYVQAGGKYTISIWITRWWEGTENTRKMDLLRDAIIKARSRSQGEDVYRKRIHAGISVDAKLVSVPLNAEITNIFVKPSFRKKQLGIDVSSIVSPELQAPKIRVIVSNPEKPGEKLPSAVFELSGNSGKEKTQYFAMPWGDPNLWEPGAPYMYKLQAEVINEQGEVLDQYPVITFGFREFWREGRTLMLNGHPFRNRIIYLSGEPEAQMKFYQGMGFTGAHFMPHPDTWRSTWKSFPVQGGLKNALKGKAVWDLADSMGWAIYLPAPGVHFTHDLLLSSEQARALYERDLKMWLRRFGLQNHPSVFAWSISMNNMGTHDPREWGVRSKHPRKWYANAQNIVKTIDPTRLVFHHQGGPNGDIEMKNHYLNFMPLQEREEYPSWWSKHGEIAIGCAEMGTPFTASFFKYGNTAQFTEYTAMYFGDKAYEKEGEGYIQAAQELLKLAPQADLASIHDDHKKAMRTAGVFTKKGFLRQVSKDTLYFDFMSMFARNTNRSFRTLGVNGGWWPWMMDIGFGVAPGHKWGTKPSWRHFDYIELKPEMKNLSQRPEWANPLYDAYRETMQPLLVYWGGVAADGLSKEHNYFSNEECLKKIVVVWDGPAKKQFTVEWALVNDGQELNKGKEAFSVTAGSIEKRDVRFKLPAVAKAKTYSLLMEVKNGQGRVISKNEIKISVLPKIDLVTTHKRWGIFDPYKNTASQLKKYGIEPKLINTEAESKGLDVLVVGRRALESGKKLPFTVDDIANGLRVLFFEQPAGNLEAFGFRIQDVVPRYAFIRTSDHPAVNGLSNIHLSNWRGEGTLLSDCSDGMRQWPWKHAIHWGNTGSVASVIIETPHIGAYTPLMECEFDLAYTPLLEWNHGMGMIVFSQLDLLSRKNGTDPAAETIIVNLLKYLDSAKVKNQARKIVFLGEKSDKNYIASLGFALEDFELSKSIDAKDILVIGAGADINNFEIKQRIDNFINAGGTVLVLPHDTDFFNRKVLGLKLDAKSKKVSSIKPSKIEKTPLLYGVGPQLLHWRSVLPFTELTPQDANQARRLLEGLLVGSIKGSSKIIFCQIDWTKLDRKSANNRRTAWRIKQFYRQLLTNLGAKTNRLLADKQFSGIKKFAKVRPVTNWLICDKIFKLSPKLDPEGRGTLISLREPLPAADVKNKNAFKWRKSTRALIDFGQKNIGVGNVGYARCWIYSSRARTAEFWVKADWWAYLRVNGAVPLDNSSEPPSGNNPSRVYAKLKQGWNLVESKTGSGAGGFNATVYVSDPGDLAVDASYDMPQHRPQSPKVLLAESNEYLNLLYAELLKMLDDPYGWHAW